MAKKFSLEAIFAGVDRVTAPIRKIKGELSGLGSSAAKAARSLDKALGKGMSVLGRASNALGLAGVASLAGVGFEMQNVMQTGAELEKVLVRTGSAFERPVRLGTKGFAELEAAARNVGKTTEFSAMQGAEALNSLATAGYTPAQSIAALPKILDFASAAVLDLGQASDITSDTLGAFNLRSADAIKNTANMGRVVDALTRAAADSTTNVAELFEGISAGAAFSATAGASLEQYIGLQGVLANKGFKGAEAGTAIRNSFSHLVKQTDEAKNAMARLGVKIAKTRDGSIDMAATVGRFTKATAKLTKEKKAEAIATIFGAYTMGPFLALMDAGEDTIRKFTAGVEGAAGVTREMSEAARESKAAKIARFFNVIEGVRLTVFSAIAPTVLEIAESIGKWVTANEELIGTKAAEWTTTLKDNLPGIAMWIERIAKTVSGFVVLSTVVKTITTIITLAGWLSTAFAWLEFTALLLGTTIGAVALPVLAIGAAIAGVVALAYVYWPEISAFFVKLKDGAIAAVGSMWEWIKGAFESAKSFAVGVFEFMVGVLRLVFAPGIEAVKAYVAIVGEWLTFAVDLVKRIWAPLSDWYSALWAGIVETQQAYFSVVVEVWSGLVGFFSGIWTAIADTFRRIVGPIIDTASGIINTIRTVGRMTLGTDGEPDAGPSPGRPAAQVISPGERAAAATAEAVAGESAKVSGKITVGVEPGTRAKIQQGKASKPRLELEPSGAFP